MRGEERGKEWEREREREGERERGREGTGRGGRGEERGMGRERVREGEGEGEGATPRRVLHFHAQHCPLYHIVESGVCTEHILMLHVRHSWLRGLNRTSTMLLIRHSWLRGLQ
jgi:hypothetical protein